MHENTTFAALVRVVRTAALAPVVLLCSCQSLPRETNAPEANKAIAQPSQQPSSPPVPAPQRPVIRPVVHHQHAAGQGGSCPHCGPGTLPAFAFTGVQPAPAAVPWKPDAIKGPWPKDEYVCD